MWRGWWYLADIYILPEHKLHSYLATLSISLAWLAIYRVLRWRGLLHWLRRVDSAAWMPFAESGFTFVSAVAGIWFWRGLWGILDLYGDRLLSTWVCALVAPLVLLLTNSLRAATFTPIGFQRDGHIEAWQWLDEAGEPLPVVGMQAMRKRTEPEGSEHPKIGAEHGQCSV